MDNYDTLIDINDKPSKWEKENVLRTCLALRALDKPIPTKIQDYIDRGLQRELDGKIAFPVTRSGKHNPLKIHDMIKNEIKDHGVNLNKAIQIVTIELNVNRRTVKDAYNKVKNDPAAFIYHQPSFLKDPDITNYKGQLSITSK